MGASSQKPSAAGVSGAQSGFDLGGRIIKANGAVLGTVRCVSRAEGRTERRGGVDIHQTNLDGQDLIAVQSSQRREPRRPLEDKHGNSR